MDNLIDIMTACTCMLKLSKHETEKEKAEAIEIFCKINEYEYNGSYVADDVRRFLRYCDYAPDFSRYVMQYINDGSIDLNNLLNLYFFASTCKKNKLAINARMLLNINVMAEKLEAVVLSYVDLLLNKMLEMWLDDSEPIDDDD